MTNHQDQMAEAKRLANSQAGQELLKLLQRSDSVNMDQLSASAASGDYAALRQNLSGFLSDPQVRKLLQQLGGSYGSNGR